MSELPTPGRAARQLTEVGGRVAPAELQRLRGIEHPGLYAWFVDPDGARQLSDGIGLPVGAGLIYAGQAGAGTSHATLESRIRGNHLDGDIYGSTFRLTLAAALRGRLALEPMGGGHMSQDGEARLTRWMREHLKVSVVPYPDRAELDTFETAVLGRLDPPLNLAKRPPTPVRRELSGLRRPIGRRGDSKPRIERRVRPVAPPSLDAGMGPTPEELAPDLGLPNAKRIRGFLRDRFPRPKSELGTRWGSLPPDAERAVRDRFGGGR